MSCNIEKTKFQPGIASFSTKAKITKNNMATHIADNMKWRKDEHFDDDVLRHPT